MKYEIGDLVRVCWRKLYPGEKLPLDGIVGMVISRRRHSRRHSPVYGVYLTNLECREVVEEDLQKL